MFDYVIFCLRTFWSRALFLIFPQKLNRLKQEREELAKVIKQFVDKYANEVDPEYQNDSQQSENNLVDVSKDDIRYLERRFSIRPTKPDLKEELKRLELEQ